ncbi:MAG: STAS domain-containing protein [Solirubrobacteraceae bacterium]|jgi:anti-anti-sigma factor
MPGPATTAFSSSQSLRAVSTAFHATTRDSGRKVAVVHAAGELDAPAAPLLEHALRHALKRGRTVVLDLRGLTRVDVFGVGVIVDASVAARHAGARLVLVRGLSQVDRLLALTGGSGDVEVVDLGAGEPALQALLSIARVDRSLERDRRRRARGVVTFVAPSQIAPGLDTATLRTGRGELIEP